MTKLYQTVIWLASVGVLTYFVKMYVLIFLVISVIIVISSKLLGKGKGKNIIVADILILVSVFLAMKSSMSLILPLGYSVFAFSAISLIVNQYRDYKDYKVLEILCYLFFFPKIFAGPIDRVDDFVRQLREKKPALERLYPSAKMCIYACFYKYVIADRLYYLCNEEYYGLNEICSILCYGVAFFFDFYAYSIFAIAFAKLLGIDLPENFDSPYRSKSFRDFWKSWNITLGIWLRDYIYIPLGGNRVSRSQWGLNILLVFVISAIWHNFTIPFILWGIIHAILLITERYFSIKGNRYYGIWVVTVCILLWQLFDVDGIDDFVFRLSRCIEYQPIDTSIIIGCIVALGVLWFADRSSTKEIIFRHRNTGRYIMKEAPITCIILVLDILLTNNSGINFFYMRF
jgi:alginate O-acetyltransferase complex protein AlgI